jgi:hypothetical protein
MAPWRRSTGAGDEAPTAGNTPNSIWAETNKVRLRTRRDRIIKNLQMNWEAMLAISITWPDGMELNSA